MATKPHADKTLLQRLRAGCLALLGARYRYQRFPYAAPFPLPRGVAVLLLGAWLLWPGVRAEAAVNGTDLLLRCEAAEKSMGGGSLSPDEMLDSMWCTGYLSGLLDGFSVSDFRVGDERAVCLPEDGLTRTDAMKTILRWLREHPEELNKSGRRNAVIALSKAYPCKKSP